MTDASPIIVWFRRDLRIADNPALERAAETGRPIIALYILETASNSGDDFRAWGGASRWWLHHSLAALTADLSKVGVPLTLQKGPAGRILDDLITQTGAEYIVWNRRYDKAGRDVDAQIKVDLKARGLSVDSFNANLLNEPWTIKSGSGAYYKVFSPYWKAVLKTEEPRLDIPIPSALKAYSGDIKTLSLNELDLLPKCPDWGQKMEPFWTPGSKGAYTALDVFLDGPVETYGHLRNFPDHPATSRLSPHLAFGEISPRQIWHQTKARTESGGKFLSEIGWREFSYTLLYYNPNLRTQNFKAYFDAFPWEHGEAALIAWQRGMTGYPLVDAGMRELWQTGWQHNRVRMITASFLIKHLMIDWRHGEAWFWDTLVDADPANNAASWQWVAGSGADAAPYFRIFNPIGQGEKFDPEGNYVRQFVPELARLPKAYIHSPWTASPEVLADAGVILGETYPHPIIDHKFARERALAAFKQIKRD